MKHSAVEVNGTGIYIALSSVKSHCAQETVLRKFGYNDDIKLADDLFPPLKYTPDHSVELTNEAIEFLKTIFEFLISSLYPNFLTTWTVLRKFGYNDDIKLADDLFPPLKYTPDQSVEKFGYNDDIKLADDLFPPLKYTPDQSVELTNEAIEFLKTIFDAFDADFDGMLRPCELEELFALVSYEVGGIFLMLCAIFQIPWIGNPYEDSAERNAFQGLSLDAFLSEWALMTLLNPTFSVENLIYLGYSGDPLSAVRVTRKRRTDRKRQLSERNVLQCFVFGPRNAGKSALLNSFIGRPYSEAYNPTIEDRYAVNVVDIVKENKKYLVLKEIPESGVEKLLANKESLASCDIAVFVHDRSVESSWRASSELLVNIAGHGENTGFEVPCLIVAAKDDLESFTSAIQDSIRVRWPAVMKGS
ncbi:unnamed protein product [Vicia faba]|uniref:EF-hand domain-containing protein n=1 Tax=Vicia faba TaxID=3906 RepID=A0AAV0ZYQ4_VICFA|nr:unnamed protein product [Vicia faba]